MSRLRSDLDFLARAVESTDALLFAWLRSHVTQRMIQEIATRDFRHHFERNWHSVEALLYGEGPQPPLSYVPFEVLMLVQFEEPEHHQPTSCWSGVSGHTKRVLSCALLLRDLVHYGRNVPYEFLLQSVPIQVTRSAVVLGGEVVPAALGTLLQFDQRQQHREVRPFIALCVLLLQMAGGLCDLAGVELLPTIKWVLETERATRVKSRWVRSSDWLWGLTQFESLLPALQRSSLQILTGPNQFAPAVANALDELAERVGHPSFR